jgi:hypothetical protein
MTIEAVRPAKTLVYIYQTIQRHIPADSNPHSHHRENLKPHIMYPLNLYVLKLLLFSLQVHE